MGQIAAVYLTDSEYGDRLIRYLKQIPKLPYQMVYFNEKTALETYLSKQKIQVLITQDSSELSTERYQKIERIIYLVSEYNEVNCHAQDQRITAWYQYQSLEQLLEILTSYHSEVSPEPSKVTSEKNDKIILSILTVEEPLHADSAIFHIASEIKQFKENLVIDFTQFGSLSVYLDEKSTDLRQTDTLSDLIYYVKDNPDATTIHVDQMIRKSRSISYIPSVNYGVDLMDLTTEDTLALLGVLDKTQYQIILPVISVLTEATIELLNRSNQILYLCSNTLSGTVHARIKKQFEQVLSADRIKVCHKLPLCEEKEMVKSIKCTLSQLLGERR